MKFAIKWPVNQLRETIHWAWYNYSIPLNKIKSKKNIFTVPKNQYIQILQSISLAILTLFIIELMFKLYVLRLDFFKSKMEIFDYTIVVVSWSLDIVFFNHDEHTMNLLIFLRLWRLIRIIHAIAVSMRAPVEHQLEQEKCAHQVTEARLDKLFNYTRELEDEIEELRNLLQNFVDELPPTTLKRIPTPRKRSKLKGIKSDGVK